MKNVSACYVDLVLEKKVKKQQQTNKNSVY